MVRAIIGVVLLSTVSAAATELTLEIMTFNVRYGTARDGENAWEHRKDILVNAIREHEPDVCGLQECLVFQAEYIVEQLPKYRWVGIDRDVTGRGEMTAVLYRHDILFPVECGHFWISETPDVPASVSWDSSLTRMATWLRFYHPETKSHFHFYNTHLDHRGSEARERGVAMIAEHAERAPEKEPVIFVGDINAPAERSKPYDIAMEKGFSDAWVEATTQVGPPVTWSAFRAPEPDVDRRIDWILYRGPIRVSRCETVLYNEDGRYPSDHYPVTATLHITITE